MRLVRLLPSLVALVVISSFAPTRPVEAGGDPTRMLDAASIQATTFKQVMFIAAPIEKCWNALIDPAVVPKYHMTGLRSVDAKVDGTMVFGSPDKSMIECRITNFVPSRLLETTFSFIDNHEPESTVTYELERITGMLTKLTLVHVLPATAGQTASDIQGGWPVILSSLKTYLETGKELVWEEKP
jgi:uncharacterized protein YndB with AHSA1/START domain